MKNNKKDVFSVLRARIPLWIVGVLLLVVIILAIAGFRITYAPELENSWSAISAVASWAGVITSSVAIIVAIQIPQKIADNQNRIELFEKRYELFETITYFISLATSITNIGTENSSAKDIRFMVASSISEQKKISIQDALQYVRPSFFINAQMIVKKTSFLFDMKFEDELSAMINSLMKIIYDDNDQTGTIEIVKYVETARNVEKTILPFIKGALEINK